MLAKLNKIKNWQAALVIIVIGFAVYSVGLKNPFLGDDVSQIVNNIPVHSLANIRLFFEGSTFYTGHGLTPLSGDYYRPLMTVTFSILYTLFGSHPFYFHLFQLAVCIAATMVLYLFFRFSFKPALSLCLALIFLIHPIDSQVVYAIPDMQDALYFFFGILGLYLLFRFKSKRSLIAVSVCLFMALLSKETAIFFVVMAVLYLFWFNRKRLYIFLATMVVPLAVWLALKVNAVGLFPANPKDNPVDALSLSGRLMNMPSVVEFYIDKCLFPWKLASGYYWINSKFSISNFLFPLIIDVIVIGLIVWTAFLIRRKTTTAKYHVFLLFAIWSALGIIQVLQIIPLDYTVFEPWFYFSMAGVLGMIGVAATTLLPALHIDRRLITLVVAFLLLILGARTTVRGGDYRSQYILAKHDVTSSRQDYAALDAVADRLLNQGQYTQAEVYARQSIEDYPTYENYENLGGILTNLGEYSAAVKAYQTSLQHDNYYITYENLAELTLLTGNANSNRQFLVSALEEYPQDSKIWTDFAIFEDAQNSNVIARVAIRSAAHYGSVPQTIYQPIIENQPFTLTLPDKLVVIP